MCKLTALQELYLKDRDISGPLPLDLRHLKNLVSLSVNTTKDFDPLTYIYNEVEADTKYCAVGLLAFAWYFSSNVQFFGWFHTIFL